jgi:hypothetical protein
MILGRRFDIDFVRPPGVAPSVRWLLAAGVLALAVVGFRCERERESGQALQQQQADLTAHLDREREATDRRRVVVTRADPQVQAQATEVLAELHRPWRGLFEQLEADRVGGVHLEQIAIDARFESLQVQAEARSLGDVLRFVEQLPGAGPIVAVQLASHELRSVPIGQVVDARISARISALDDAGAARAAP